MTPLQHIADPAQAMAMETALFQRGSHGTCTLWTTRRCLVVPRSMMRRPGFSDARACLLERDVAVVARTSGGGVVPQGPGILNLTATVSVAPHARSLVADYAWLCAPLTELLGAHGIDARLGRVPGSFCDGEYNVVVAGRKIAGTAQRRSRTSALLHMVLLVNPELPEALDAIRDLRRHIGDATPLVDDAHVALASLSGALSDPSLVAQSLKTRVVEHLDRRDANRPDHSGPNPRNDRTTL